MARKKLEQRPIVVPLKLTLRIGEDDDLINFFSLVPDRLRAASIKQALRSGGMSVPLDNLPSDDEVEAALDGLLG